MGEEDKDKISLEELLELGNGLVDDIAKITKKEKAIREGKLTKTLEHEEVVKCNTSYSRLGKTYSEIKNKCAPPLGEGQETIPGGKVKVFDKIEKAVHIAMLESHIPYNDGSSKKGYYGLINDCKEKGDADYVIPLLKFAMSSHIVSRDNGLGRGFLGTNYAQRITQAIDEIQSNGCTEVEEIIKNVRSEIKKAKLNPSAFSDPKDYGTGVLYYTKIVHGKNLKKALKRLNSIVHFRGI